MDYKVELDTFRGPLDLLLFLVKHHEVDLSDIPIARILEQFLEHLQMIQVIDVEGAGEFLVMAATLMEIKSRMLLPRGADEQAPEEDPRLELVKQLIEYKKYKEAASLLEEQARRQMARLARVAPEGPVRLDPAQQPLRRVELWDLVSAFGRLMRETAALEARPIVMDETPMHVHMERIDAQVRARGRLSLRELFVAPLVRGRLLGLFLAILELMKNRQLAAEQPVPFGDIWLVVPIPPSEEGATGGEPA